MSHSLLGVPIYDSLQGTGDRLPYQASWAQSMSWPLRFLVGWEYYAAIRTLVFTIPSILIGMLVLRSWLPQASAFTYLAFALLSNTSLGIYTRWNDWSDHYVQTVGICAPCLFLMHKHFHVQSQESQLPHSRWILFCLILCLNGVLTGHPGFWPIAAIVPVLLYVSLATSAVFRRRFSAWVRLESTPIAVGAVSLLITFSAIVGDLLPEIRGQVWGERRLSRTQGFFSEYAFQGIYGLRPDGFLFEPLRRAVSVLVATTVVPFFVLFDTWLPRLARATDYPELTRLEFSGSLVLLVLLFRFKRALTGEVRSLVARLAIAQFLIWVFVVAAALDQLPTALSPSGAWLVLPVVLVMNVFLSILIVQIAQPFARAARVIAVGNVALVAAWSLFQFGALAMGTGFQIPERISTWSQDQEEMNVKIPSDTESAQSQRLILTAALERRPLMNLLALGIPVIAPADPKIRTQDHLVDGFAFNYSLAPSLELMSARYTDRLLDFLQVTEVVLDPTEKNQFSNPIDQYLADERTSRVIIDLPNRWEDGVLQRKRVQVLSRSRFSAFLVDEKNFVDYPSCPVLKQECSLVEQSKRVGTTNVPKLQRCEKECLWTFESPAVSSSYALLLPVTFDDSIIVRDQSGRQLHAKNIGGFLATHSNAGIEVGTLTLELYPDWRMFGRVATSYLSLVTLATFVLFAVRGSSATSNPRRNFLRLRAK